ncbi:unnamed protein product [Allacma fusca]|uniref:Uncharacterized protein n=1 Tax=Allacma fusca TaxID=39272 RepID=A0A8J2KWN3_9HEXA|nr:unnamed protein product [Allacma fusca]
MALWNSKKNIEVPVQGCVRLLLSWPVKQLTFRFKRKKIPPRDPGQPRSLKLRRDWELKTLSLSSETENSSSSSSSQLYSEVNVSDKPNAELPEDIESGADVLVIHPVTETDTMGTEVATDEKDNLIRKLRLKLHNRDKRISRLKYDLARFEPEEDDKVDIGLGNLVWKNLLAELKMEHRHNPGVFLRKLMERRGIFSLEEIANSSLTGQKHHDGLQRPRLDFKRFYHKKVQDKGQNHQNVTISKEHKQHMYRCTEEAEEEYKHVNNMFLSPGH